MSKSSDTVLHGDVDESMLFDDGFSIVDDINAGTGVMETGGQKGISKKSGNECKDQSAAIEDINSKEVVSDKEVKNEEPIEKKEATKEVVEKENEKNISKKVNVATDGEKIVVKKEKSIESKISNIKNSNASGETTLIISNDEDLGPDVPPSDDTPIKSEKKGNELKNEIRHKVESKNTNEVINSSVNKITPRKKNTESNVVWVSNISKLVKASSLKKHFAECGKVNTARVVTNGKELFGYVQFESSELALTCVKMLNNSILGGKKIIVSRNRPDVNKKVSSAKKISNNDTITPNCDEMKKESVCTKDGPGQLAEVELKQFDDDARKIEENTKDEEQKSGERGAKDDDKKITEVKKRSVADEKRSVADEKKLADEKSKNEDKKPRSVKNDMMKGEDDLKKKLNDCKKKIDDLRQDLTRSQIEISNLHRRLKNEQKKSRAEEIRSEKYRTEVRSLTDQLKQTRSDFDKEMHRVVKKHKLELEKAEYHHRDSFLKQKEELKRRQEELDREFRKLDEAKKTLEHMKRSRKSRSMSPPIKRFRGRDGAFHDHRSPPPPPKLSSEVRPKTSLDRPPIYYEEKKPRGIYDRLGDYGEKPFPKETNGRERNSYPNDVGMQKSSWTQSSADSWKKPNNTTTFLKPYMERFGSSHPGYQVPSTSYYSPGTVDYTKHNHFDISRKY